MRDLPCGGLRIYLQLDVRRINCRHCGVKTETLALLAKNPRYTRRFAMDVGERCRAASIKEVALATGLHWETVKQLEMEYMQMQLDLAGEPDPRYIGIDEIGVRKGHKYKIVVSDLEKRRAIWMGGDGRREEDMAKFFHWLGPKKSARIRLALMDMWKPFRNATRAFAPQAAIVFDKFHIISHLNDALDEVRRREYKRLSGEQRRYIKGQRYTLLSRKENLTLAGRTSLRLLLKNNRRLHVAYLLKEQFGQLWDYRGEGWARRFFDHWKAALRWQRLAPFEKFANMIERHWDGIAAWCTQDIELPMGFVEGLNNKIRVFQRRAYGLRDAEYLRLKTLTCTLPPLPQATSPR